MVALLVTLEGLHVTDGVLMQQARLVKERETLVRNISCLFKTAQLEIQRKDSELKQLRDRLSDQSRGVGRGSI